jgi:GTPase SAR1 family protein
MTTKRIAFLGTAGCGKTTLAHDLFVTLKKQGKNTDIVTEYARDYINQYGPPENIFEQYHMYNQQSKKEDSIPANVEYLISDTIRSLGYFYAALYSGKSERRSRLVLNDMHEYLLNDIYNRRYSQVFYLPMAETYAKNPEILKDGTRYQSEEEILALEAHLNLVFTQHHKLDNIHILDCPLEDRLNTVLDIITT